jgi:hypothetical protein
MMLRIRIFAVLALLAASASAQTGPCSGGGGPNPLFTVAQNAGGIQLYFEHAALITIIPGTTVTVTGNNITVEQLVSHIPPPPQDLFFCDQAAVSLGVLAPGSYNVVWRYRDESSPTIINSWTFSFAVPVNVPVLSGSSFLGLLVLLASLGVVILRR